MRLGAVFTPSGKGNGSLFREKMRLYQAMRPDVCRVTQYWGDYTDPSTGGIFTPDQLREIVRATGTEVILQSSEVPHWWQAKPQLEALRWLIDEFPGKAFTFEIMNEPDHGELNGDPDQAAVRAISCAQVLRRDIGGNHYGYLGYGPGNLWYAIGQPSGNRPGGGDNWYFDAYNGKEWYGERVLDAAEISAVHCYASYESTLCPNPAPDSLTRKIYNWVRIWRPSKIVKITEAGISSYNARTGPDGRGNYGSIRGFDYLHFANQICDQHDGKWITDAVCFFGLPWTGRTDVQVEVAPGVWRPENTIFDLTDSDCNQIGTRDFGWAQYGNPSCGLGA